MKKRFTTMAVLLASIYIVNSMVVFDTKQLPKSKPTEVELFMDEIAKIESPGAGYKAVSSNGMLGRYQFSPSTVRTLGFNVTAQEFLRNKTLQDTVMIHYMKANYRELVALIDRYNGKTVNGVRVTRAGILAGAHFAGTTGVRAFLVSNGTTDLMDGNGTTMSKYMGRFSKFALPPFAL